MHSPLAPEALELLVVHAYIYRRLFQLSDRSLHNLHTTTRRNIRTKPANEGSTMLFYTKWTYQLAAALCVGFLWVT